MESDEAIRPMAKKTFAAFPSRTESGFTAARLLWEEKQCQSGSDGCRERGPPCAVLRPGVKEEQSAISCLLGVGTGNLITEMHGPLSFSDWLKPDKEACSSLAKRPGPGQNHNSKEIEKCYIYRHLSLSLADCRLPLISLSATICPFWFG